MINKTLFVLVLSFASGNILATPMIFDYGFNIDGTASIPTSGDAIPGGVDLSGFDQISGLGQITVTVDGIGPHFFDVFIDLEIDEPLNSFFNELGATGGGAPSAGLSWEIDEPSFGSLQNGSAGLPYIGDIFDNFVNSALDNQFFFDSFDNQSLSPPDDVSVALGWDFSLLNGEEAMIDIFSSTTNNAPGFFLSHTDPDTPETVYFWTSLDINKPVLNVPEPSMILLLFIGLAGFRISICQFKTCD